MKINCDEIHTRKFWRTKILYQIKNERKLLFYMYIQMHTHINIERQQNTIKRVAVLILGFSNIITLRYIAGK